MKDMKVTKKIAYSAILLSFAIVSTMVFKSVSMGSFSFLRFSLTPSIVIFSSIALGPLYGAAVGVFADMIPAFLLPQGAFNPFLSLVYALLGVLPYFLLSLTKRFPKIFANPFPSCFLFLLFISLLAVALYATPVLDGPFGDNGLWLKPLILGLTVTGAAGALLLLWTLEKRKRGSLISDDKGHGVYELAFVSGISEMIAMCFLKALAFFLFFLVNNAGDSPFSYWYILAMLTIGMAPSTIIDVYFVSWFLSFAKRLLD